MKSFLSLVVRDILDLTGNDPGRSVFIFPNRRSGRVFLEEMHHQINGPVLSPEVLSIDDWMIKLSGFVVPDRNTSLAALYPIIRKRLDYRGSFAQFMDFGEMILSDFDDVDRYLADPARLFRGLTEYKMTETVIDSDEFKQLTELIARFWGSFSERVSRHQENWLATWEQLDPIYHDFHHALQSKGMATSGYCYRAVAEKIEHGGLLRMEQDLFGLVGFNALTRAEEVLFEHLQEAGKARFYWDYHPFYCNGAHEAGRFITPNLVKFPAPENFTPFPDGYSALYDTQPDPPLIRILPVTSQSGQTHLLTALLQEEPIGNRGIILADEAGLPDLIRSWSDDLLSVNFSSGYPTAETVSATLIRSLTYWLTDKKNGIPSSYSTERTLALLKHPLMQACLNEEEQDWLDVLSVRYPEAVPEDFFRENQDPSVIGLLPSLYEKPLDVVSMILQRILEGEIPDDLLERAALTEIQQEVDHLRRIVQQWDLPLDAEGVFKLLSRFLQKKRITLESEERTAGTLVTGVLETRLLDFDEVYIMSLNEGTWPSKSLPSSLIPYSLRKFFQLPVAEHRDRIYSYYFYRLLQRARKVTLLYITGHRDDQISSGEKSRYITQLELETPLEVQRLDEPAIRVAIDESPLIIQKSGKVLAKLNSFLDPDTPGHSISPSSLKEYLDCPLRFAFSRILDIREPWEAGTASEPKGFGTLIHLVMEELYQPFSNKPEGPDDQWFEALLQDQNRVAQLLVEMYPKALETDGIHHPGSKEQLGLDIARNFVDAIVQVDRQEAPFKIIRMEESIRCSYCFEERMGGRSVNLGGIIDRIDRTADGIRILDYKTGKTSLNFKEIGSIFKASSRLKDVFQVLLYCEMFGLNHGWEEPLVPVIYPVMNFLTGDSDTRITISKKPLVYQEIRQEFRAGLGDLLAELFDASVPFMQTADIDTCKYCLYSGICRRDS